jgi:hypothetical protein
MARQHRRAHSVSKKSTENIFERRGLVESHLSIAPREGRDFFAERDEYLLLCPVEIRIDEAVQVAWETRKEAKYMKSHRSVAGHLDAHSTSRNRSARKAVIEKAESLIVNEFTSQSHRKESIAESHPSSNKPRPLASRYSTFQSQNMDDPLEQIENDDPLPEP